MENRDKIIELLTAVRYTTNDIEKVADKICSLSIDRCGCEEPTPTEIKVCVQCDGYVE